MHAYEFEGKQQYFTSYSDVLFARRWVLCQIQDAAGSTTPSVPSLAPSEAHSVAPCVAAPLKIWVMPPATAL